MGGGGGRREGWRRGNSCGEKESSVCPLPLPASWAGWLAPAVAFPTGRCWVAAAAAGGGGCAELRPVLEGYKSQKRWRIISFTWILIQQKAQEVFCNIGTVQRLVGAAPSSGGLIIATLHCSLCYLLRESLHPLNLEYFQSRTSQLQVSLSWSWFY